MTKEIEGDSKKETVKKISTKTAKKSDLKEKRMTARERDELLIENFVGLQHAMTNMSIKFGSLSDNISKLLQVFEEAAKSFATGGKTNNEDMLKKINSLLDQNKTIAKGLVLMEGSLRGRAQTPPREIPSHKPKPLPSI